MKKLLGIAIISLLLPVSTFATNITFTSNGSIVTGDIYDYVYVRNDGTVVTMSGGQVSQLYIYDGSVFNFSTGQIKGTYQGSVSIYGDSIFRMTGGSADLFELCLFSTGGEFVIENGILNGDRVKIYSNTRMSLHGGQVTFADLYMLGSAQLDIYEGNVAINVLSVNSTDVVNIYGGSVNIKNLDYMHPSSSINIYGYDFKYNPTTYVLDGYLSDGNFFTIKKVSVQEYARINLIPEPMSIILFGLSLFALRKRK